MEGGSRLEGGSTAAESPAHRRLSAACSQMNLLPVEVIGTILSYVASARDVIRSSATCRNWREAVKGHLHRLSFDDSDFQIKNIPADNIPADDDDAASASWDVIIVDSVMQVEHLYDLSISYGVCMRRVHAAVAIALLRHTKHTLKSLTLLAPVKQRLDVLEKLALFGTPLERLVWGPAYISALSPRVHGIPSLVSLTLNKSSLKFEDFCLLFSIFPKLEQLSLARMDVEGLPPVIEINPSSSLKTITLEMVHLGVSSLLVRGRSLESVSLVGMFLEGLDWDETEGSMHVRNLLIRTSILEKLVLIGSLQSLVLCNSRIEELQTCPLPSLIELKFFKVKGLASTWPGYSQVISMLSSRVSKLHLLGGFPGIGIVDVNKIASSFPCLQFLSLDFNYSFFEGQQPLAFQKVVVLELRTIMQQTNRELFSDCIFKFLSCCPSLKRLVLMLEDRRTGHGDSLQFVGQLVSLLISRMHAYPLIDVKFKFD